MGKSTVSMAIFNSYVKLPEGTIFQAGKNTIFVHFLGPFFFTQRNGKYTKY
jgi:hypothetical protein